jgi:hypothetical protein
MKNYLRKSTLKGLTADCVRRKIKIIKTVYSQERNKIMKSKKRSVGTNYLYKPNLLRFEIQIVCKQNRPTEKSYKNYGLSDKMT